jgi:methyl-accepting chemotaxis protein
MSEEGREVADEMRQLEQLAAQTNSAMTEIGIGATEINHAVTRVYDLSRDNSRSVEAVVGRVMRFKLREDAE